MKRVLLLVLVGVFLCAGSAVADTIDTLFNTGVDSTGTPLLSGTIGDPHYELISVPNGSSDIRVITSTDGWPVGVYMGDNSLSAWIGPNNDPDLSGYYGTYTYRTTFDLTGYDPTTAFIEGEWSSDNNGLDILINGISLGYTTTTTAYKTFSPFLVDGGFVEGLNTLDFLVNNGATPGFPIGSFNGGPTALRVEMTGTAAPVPEPSTMLLFGTGLIGLAGYRRKFKR